MKRLPSGGRFIMGATNADRVRLSRPPGLHPPTIFKTSMEIWNECNR